MSRNTKIAIVLGSDSDLPKVEPAFKFLDELEIGYKVTIASAHRTPQLLHNFVNSSIEEGVKVFIAAAGGAAHLPGVIASMTQLPIIGIPIKGKSLEGADSLYSIVQMPPGVPVATVGIDAAKNAAILACQILSVSDDVVYDKITAFREEQRKAVEAKAAALLSSGIGSSAVTKFEVATPFEVSQ
jgi:5-(carboxyamino)imidazole ribonucleotide mutase